MKRFVVGLLCCSTGCALLPLQPGKDLAGSDAWRAIDTESFHLETNLDADDAKDLLLGLERDRLVMSQILGIPVSPVRLELIVFRDWAQFHVYGFKPYAGFATQDGFEPLVVMTRQGFQQDLLGPSNWGAHELAHVLSWTTLKRQPRWLAEGLASYLETLKYSSDGREVVVGRPNEDVLRYLASRSPIGLEELWRWGPGRPLDSAEEKKETLRYASSWRWVHFLINAQPKRFEAFLAGLKTGREPRAAWDEAFSGVGFTDLDEELARYTHEIFPVKELAAPAFTTGVTERMLGDDEVHALLARVAPLGPSSIGEERRQRIAQSEIEAGLAANPNSLALALVEVSAAPPARKALLAQKLSEAHPESSLAQYAWAHAVCDPPAQASCPEVVARIAAMDAPDLEGLSWSAAHLIWTERFEEGLARVDAALVLAPESVRLLMLKVFGLYQLGRCVEAQSVAGRAVEAGSESLSPVALPSLLAEVALYANGCTARAQGH